MRVRLFGLPGLLLLLACRAPDAPPENATEVAPSASQAPEPDPKIVPDDSRPDDPPAPTNDDAAHPLDPIGYLDALVSGANGGSGPPGGTTLDPFPVAGWIRSDHVTELLDRLDSDEPALHVVQTRCSVLPMTLSTEGMQAQFLLDSLRNGLYPPRLSSASAMRGDPATYRAWWDQLQRIEQLPLPTDENGAVPWQRFGPGDLLDLVRRHAGAAVRLPVHPPYGWIDDQGAATLIDRVASERPCAALIVHRLPEDPPPPTTEGATARMLLHLYREAVTRHHHAILGNPHDGDFEQDPAVWKAWWRERRDTRE